jgi:hypothetical protein
VYGWDWFGLLDLQLMWVNSFRSVGIGEGGGLKRNGEECIIEALRRVLKDRKSEQGSSSRVLSRIFNNG